MSFELLNSILNKGNKKVVKENTNNFVLPESEKRINESDITFSELDNLVESAMRDTLKKTIQESNMDPSLLNVVDNSVFTEEQVYDFMKDTIDPILESVGTLTNGRLLNSDSRVRGVSLPVYEVALTLESARLGALTMESLDDTPIKEEVDPHAQELEDVIHDVVNGGVKDETYTNDKKVVAKASKFKEPAKMNNVTKAEILEAAKQLFDHERHLKNKTWKIPADGGGSHPKQPKRDSDIPDTVDDLYEYEGDIAGDPDEDYFEFEDQFDETTVVGKIMNKLNEDCMADESEDLDVEYTPKSDKNIKTYRGKEAGKPDSKKDKFTQDGTGDEHIVEQQTIIAKYLLGRIFNEYGITEKDVQRTIVREAVHYIFKYGAENLYPAISDMATLVTEQNKLADVNGIETSRFIVEETKPFLTDDHIDQIVDKSLAYMEALEEAVKMTKTSSKAPRNAGEKERMNVAKGVGTSNKPETVKEDCEYCADAEAIVESIGFITYASEIERNRQAFRYRMNKFNENAKVVVAESWVSVDQNLTESATELADYITVRRFVSEADDMKEFFKTIKEDSPVYRSSLKKANSYNDSLVTATIFSEVVTVWRGIKDSMYNNQPLDSKHVAVKTMLEGVERYKDMVSAVKNPVRIKTVLENFAYRLNSLKDKIEYKLVEFVD
jgi:hypothetical protein